jgi:uncharacterized protein (TIGR00369 family)
MALADSLGGACVYLSLPEGARTATISSSTVFLLAVREGEIAAVCRPLHAGASAITLRTEVRDGNGRTVAETTQAQVVLGAQRIR